MHKKILWDSLDPALRKQIEDEIGHPILGSSEFVRWNQDYVYPGSKIQRELMYNPPESMDIDSRIYRDYVDDYKVIPGRTFLVQFAQLLGRWLASSQTGETITEVDQTTTANMSPQAMTEILDVLGGASSSTFGPTVGSTNTAVARTDSKLGTKIAHGATATTLQYGAASVSTVSNPSGTISRVQVTRSYTGNAGSTVDVQEDGLEAEFDTGIYTLIYRNVNAFGAVAASQVITQTVNVDVTS